MAVYRKYSLDESFFDNIDNEIKAYYLGFIYADGNHTRNGRKYTIRLALNKKDIHILEEFNKHLSHAKPLRHSKYNDMVELEIASKHISGKMLELGVVPRKTFLLEFPNWIDENLKHHFLRGYFDGDGYVGVHKPKKSKLCCVTCMVSTESFCFSVKKILQTLNVNCYIRPRHPERNTNTRQLEVGGNIQVKRFLDYLYKDATVFLKRKYKIYKDFYYG